jgi:arginine decarboxylase
MDRHGVQINKTSRNTVLFMTNIGTTRSSVAFLVEVLVKIARELDEHISEMGLGERSRFEQKVRRLTARAVVQPDFSGFHSVFRDHSGVEDSPEGPYPPGFPVLVPGQVVSRQILAFIRDLDTPEIHGYKPDFGHRVYTEKAIEMCRPADAPIGNGHRPLPAESPEPAVDRASPPLGNSCEAARKAAGAGSGTGVALCASA